MNRPGFPGDVNLSHVISTDSAGCEQWIDSASAAETLPIGSIRRRLLNQSTQLGVAHSTSSRLRQDDRRCITAALHRPLMVSASAFSYELATLPTEGSRPASANPLACAETR